MITIVQRAKVIGVFTAVNVGTLYSCKFHRTLTLSGWLLWMTQVRFNITLLHANFIYYDDLNTLFMLSGLSLLCAAPSDRIAAVRIEGIKGEVTVMSKRQHVSLSPNWTSTSAGQVWLRSGLRPLPDSTLTPRWAGGRTQQTLTQMIVAE